MEQLRQQRKRFGISVTHRKWGATEGFVGEEKPTEHCVSGSHSSAQGNQHLLGLLHMGLELGTGSGSEAGAWQVRGWRVVRERKKTEPPSPESKQSPQYDQYQDRKEF